MSHWTDSIVGDRMAVDQQFTDRVQASQFSSQEWGLIMTATELEIENAENPEAARIVANTENVESILPELENIRTQMQSMSGTPSGSASGGTNAGGLFASIKRTLGIGGGGTNDGVDPEQLDAAEQLTQAYADALQEHLESNGTFERARTAYVDSN